MKLFHFLALSSLCLIAPPSQAQQSNSAPQTSVQEPSSVGPSLRAHLQLKAAQIEDLNALYDNWVNTRGDFSQVRERALQILTPLQRAQLNSIAKDSRLRVRDDQYSQLLLATLGAPNVRNQRDEYRNDDNRRDSTGYDDNRRNNERQRQSQKSRKRSRAGSGSYGVYGGYGYGGPNYGVYGNYGQGNVGVGATIGRYGPSIGINVGRVFGGRWLR